MRKIEPANTQELRGALTIKATAKFLDCSVISVRRLVRRGLLRPNRALKTLRFSIGDLQRFLKEY